MISPEGIYRNLHTKLEKALFWGLYALLLVRSGHPSQMPQVLNHFHLEAMVGWRGVIGYQENPAKEFTESPGWQPNFILNNAFWIYQFWTTSK